MDEKQISELLECSVCLERFDQNCKVLPCQHTFCRQCLDEIILTKHELRCPECRALVTVRVSELPTNILVVRILEGLKTKGQRLSGSDIGHHSPSLSSSPSKALGSGQLSLHDTVPSHLFRQGTQPCAKALYNYESSEKDDLPFKKGDMILLRRKIDDNWFQGEIEGRCGFFPANFVQVIVPLPQIPQCISLYDFELRDEGEKDCLSFKKDEVLTVIRRVDENWLEGRKGDKIGIFPLTFVKLNEAARSLINTKSNLINLPGTSSNNTPTTSSGITVPSGTASTVSSNRTDGNTSGSNSSTPAANGTAHAGLSSTTACSSNSIIVSEANSANAAAVTTANSIILTSTIPDSTPLDTDSADGQQAVVASPEARTNTLQETSVASSSSCQPDSVTTIPITPSSAPSTAPEVLAQNKRHSFTSASLSSPLTAATTISGHTQQRHSAEITMSEGGGLSLVNKDIVTSLSSSLPSSAVMETQPVAAASQKNTPALPVVTSEGNGEASTSSTSSGSAQSGSLTTPVYIALYNYKPRKDDELELHKGDHYAVVEKCQDGWYRGSCIRTGATGVFPGNYVQQIRHSSAFKPVSANILNLRPKGPAVTGPNSALHTVVTNDPRHVLTSRETSSQAPPLMPRVAKMNSTSQSSRSPLFHLGGANFRSLSTPATSSVSPKHVFSSQLSSSPHVPPQLGLSRPLIPAPPPTTTSSPHHSLWVPPSLAAMQHSMSALSSTTPPNVVMTHCMDTTPAAVAPAGKEKKEKKEKEKKGLVKLLSGKSKKTKQVPVDPEPAPPLSVVCFDSGIHMRSGSYPVNGTAVSSISAGGDVLSAHRKAASFDATTVPPIPAKPRPKLTVRERYCCIVPYPPQTEHELCLELGDIIHVHRKREDGWYKGTQERTGKTGLFPASFVEKCD